ncbi:phage terminase small subunit [Anaerocolumna sp.]|uniref:phage terminase small subunit n=1 Tax=Anaerocolumna sp. TaxID=2041569 RepID=UPI0028A7CCA0|nr:phage terminase small subunit [Anaerocolumna sp.]
MARAPDKRAEKAHELYQKGLKLIEIASQLDIPEGTVRSWKNRYKWNATLQSDKRNVAKRNKGGQPGNKNANGGPPGNKKAEKHGFFAKWLPEETREIMGAIQSADSLDLLWDNIQLQYTAIIRAQKLMYVRDQEDKTIEKIEHGYGETSEKNKWEVQQAWDKHATFLNAQSRAMKTLEGMIKQYDELLNRNWELATEEQKARIAILKDKVSNDKDKPIQITFTKASEKNG